MIATGPTASPSMELRRDAAQEHVANRAAGKEPCITVAEALSGYERAKGKCRNGEQFRKHLGNEVVCDLTPEVIKHFAPIVCPNVSLSTQKKEYYGRLAAFIHYAASQGLCPYVRVDLPVVATGQHIRCISPTDAQQVADECLPHFKPLYLLMLLAACEVSEAVHLQWSKVNLTAGQVRLPRRAVILPPLVRSQLEKLRHRDGSTFRCRDGSPYKFTGRPADSIRTSVEAAFRRAKVQPYGVRDIRMTACMYHLAVHRDLGRLMELGGWQDTRSLGRFRKVSKAELDALRIALSEQQWDNEVRAVSVVR
jgi:integrase